MIHEYNPFSRGIGVLVAVLGAGCGGSRQPRAPEPEVRTYAGKALGESRCSFSKQNNVHGPLVDSFKYEVPVETQIPENRTFLVSYQGSTKDSHICEKLPQVVAGDGLAFTGQEVQKGIIFAQYVGRANSSENKVAETKSQ